MCSGSPVSCITVGKDEGLNQNTSKISLAACTPVRFWFLNLTIIPMVVQPILKEIGFLSTNRDLCAGSRLIKKISHTEFVDQQN